ncbi:MAG: hypothetical protein RLY43_218 [Bacteroidota bacterium]|jgi:hypothetical protein
MIINLDWYTGTLIVAAFSVIAFFLVKIYDKVDSTHDFVIKQDEKNVTIKDTLNNHETRIKDLEIFTDNCEIQHYNHHGKLIKG